MIYTTFSSTKREFTDKEATIALSFFEEKKREILKKNEEDNVLRKEIPPEENTSVKKDIARETKNPKKKETKLIKPIKSIDKKADEPDEEIEKNDEDKEIESLNLSAREKFNIQSQLKMCYSRAVKLSNAKNQVSLSVSISIDGEINTDIEKIADLDRYGTDLNYKIAIDNAIVALELCSPLRNMPMDKYDIWKEVVVEFGD
jgi:hypothetical protein